ncbi:MAG: hypothetical protein ACRD2A_26510, partial [Vicinamibacterales bacterium]
PKPQREAGSQGSLIAWWLLQVLAHVNNLQYSNDPATTQLRNSQAKPRWDASRCPGCRTYV